MIKILIVDDHPLIRHGLRQILSQYSDIAVEALVHYQCNNNI